MKYVGVTIDVRLLFKEYLLNADRKASMVARALAGIVLNIGDPKQNKVRFGHYFLYWCNA